MAPLTISMVDIEHMYDIKHAILFCFIYLLVGLIQQFCWYTDIRFADIPILLILESWCSLLSLSTDWAIVIQVFEPIADISVYRQSFLSPMLICWYFRYRYQYRPIPSSKASWQYVEPTFTEPTFTKLHYVVTYKQKLIHSVPDMWSLKRPWYYLPKSDSSSKSLSSS